MDRTLRWPPVRGPYHRLLFGLLSEKYAQRAFTQESLGAAVEKDQKSIGNYLNDKNGAPLDLDEADAALAHIGTSLKAFIADPAHVVPAPHVSQVARALETALRALTDDADLQVVLDAAKGRLRARRSKTQSVRPRAVGQKVGARKTGGTR